MAMIVAMPPLLSPTLRGAERDSCAGKSALFRLTLLCRTRGLPFQILFRLGQPAGIPQRPSQQELDLSVHAA